MLIYCRLARRAPAHPDDCGGLSEGLALPDACRTVELDSGRIELVFYPGARATVVLIHGNSASKDSFLHQITVLRQNGFGVVALDLPGHGGSEDAKDPAETYSFPGYASVVAAVLDALSIEHAHVVGWSLGGHIGLELMARDHRVRSLLIFGTPPAKPSPEVMGAAFLQTPAMEYAGRDTLSADESAMYAQAMAGGGSGPPPGLVEAIQRTDGKARVYMMRSALSGVGLDARDLVENDPRPLAVLHGAEDPFVNLAYLTNIAYRNIWRHEVQILPGVGHAAHWQVPEVFNAILISFLLSSSG